MGGAVEEDCFKKGAMVEVSSDDRGLRGSWYIATVLRPVGKKSRSIFVQYKTLVTAKDNKKPLREFVDLLLVRPIAPRETHRVFHLSDEVDAFHHDGWWEGIVTAVLDSGRYSVFFRQSREQIEFDGSDLRLHREWVYGKWVPPLEGSPCKNSAETGMKRKRKSR